MPDIHIGEFILAELRRQGKSASWLAKKIFCTRSHIYKIFGKENLDIYLLRRISQALHHDFFKDLSDNWKEDFCGSGSE